MPFLMAGFFSLWAINHAPLLLHLSTGGQIVFWLAAAFATGLALLPSSYVASVAGFIWGFACVWPLVISYMLATAIGYYVSRWLNGQKIMSQLQKNPKAKAILERFQNEQFIIIVLSRLSPVFPFGVSNVVFSYLGVRLPNLLLAGILGMFPRSLFLVYLASKASYIQSLFESGQMRPYYLPVGILAVASSVALGYLIFFKKGNFNKSS